MVCLLWVFGLPSLRGQVFLPYDAKGVTEQQKGSNPSRLAYPTSMLKQIEDEIAQNCGCALYSIGEFSVGENKIVRFAPGNLQYQASTDTWRFAEHQYDKVGNDQTDWMDLFGWGTGDAPTKTSQNPDDYAVFTDWGVNRISNGGNQPNMWRTLTNDEWAYLFCGRENAARLFATGNVNRIPGMILLPDNWQTPAGQVFYPSTTKGLIYQADHDCFYANEGGGNFYHNTYTTEQWQVMEQAGAVFLPGSGVRVGTTVGGTFGYYHSSTVASWKKTSGFYMYFCAMYVGPGYTIEDKSCGKSVRLVCDPTGETDEPAEPQVKELKLKLSTTSGGSVVVLDFFEKPDTVRVGYTVTLKKTGKIESFVVNIKALPDEGYSFTQWSDGNADNPRTVTVTEDMTLSAYFAKSGGSGGKGIGVFSVSDTKKVTFSPGNLQYQASTDTWRFAEHQWDFIGEANKNISPTYSGWIDLFGWGTGDAPTKTSTDDNDYSTFTDWGINPISNGGNTANQWRTLTMKELIYIFEERKNAIDKYGAAKVNDVNGLVVLPDDWTLPYGCTFTAGMTNASYLYDWSEVTNIYNSSQWELMENSGVVFLPASGSRYGTSVLNVGTHGSYWSSTLYNNINAHMLYIYSNKFGSWGTSAPHGGESVRLVSEL